MEKLRIYCGFRWVRSWSRLLSSPQFRRALKQASPCFIYVWGFTLRGGQAQTRTCKGGLSCFKPSFHMKSSRNLNPRVVASRIKSGGAYYDRCAKWTTVNLRLKRRRFIEQIQYQHLTRRNRYAQHTVTVHELLNPLSFLHNPIKSCCMRKRSSPLQQLWRMTAPTASFTERWTSFAASLTCMHQLLNTRQDPSGWVVTPPGCAICLWGNVYAQAKRKVIWAL